MTKKGKTEGKNTAGLQAGKRLQREEGTVGPWAGGGGHGCKPQQGKFGIDPWRNALGKREARDMWGLAPLWGL